MNFEQIKAEMAARRAEKEKSGGLKSSIVLDYKEPVIEYNVHPAVLTLLELTDQNRNMTARLVGLSVGAVEAWLKGSKPGENALNKIYVVIRTLKRRKMKNNKAPISEG